MGLLRRIFGSGQPRKPGDDDSGFFMYVLCGNCGDKVRLRVHKSHDLNREGGGYVWHKTIVDSRCFRPIPCVVHFDSSYSVSNSEISGGEFISREQFEAGEVSQPTDAADGDH